MVWLIGNDWMEIDADGDDEADGYGERQGILRGDFGFSFRTRAPVMEEIAARLPNTIYLVGITLLITFIISIPIGIVSAVKQYSPLTSVLRHFPLLGNQFHRFGLG